MKKIALSAIVSLGLVGSVMASDEIDKGVNPLLGFIGAQADGSATIASDVLWRGVSQTAEGVGGEIDLVLDVDTNIGNFYVGGDVAGSTSNASVIYKAGYENTWGDSFPVLTIVEYNYNDFQNTAEGGGVDLRAANFQNVLTTLGVNAFGANVWVKGEFVVEENDTADYNTEDRFGIGADYTIGETIVGNLALNAAYSDQEKWGSNWEVGISNPITQRLEVGIVYNDFTVDEDTQSGLTEDTQTVVGKVTYLF